MRKGTTTVAIVVDPEFGERLFTLAEKMTVWIADTPVNRPCAESIWSTRDDQAALPNVTTFKVAAGESPEASCVGLLGTVDLHHGPYSQTPAYSAVEVFGAQLTPELREALAKFDLDSLTERPDGFRAERTTAAEATS